MKKLTQEVFKDAPDWVRSAAKTRFATVMGYSCESSELVPTPNRHTTTGNLDSFKFEIIGFCDDTTNWQNSAIDREVKP